MSSGVANHIAAFAINRYLGTSYERVILILVPVTLNVLKAEVIFDGVV